MKKIMSRIILFMFGLFLALVLGELAVRVYRVFTIKTKGKIIPAMYVEDSKLGWGLKPSYEGIVETDEFSTKISINSKGFRDSERADMNEESVKKVMGLGDSFTFGYGVEFEKTYLSLLENLLNSLEDNSTTYKVYKYGVPGYSIKEEYLLSETLAPKVKPNLIMVGFDINDHTDCSNSWPKYRVKGGNLFDNLGPIKDPSEKASIWNYLLDKSYLYPIIKRVIKTVDINRNIESNELKAWRCAEEYLGNIKKLARENDSALLIFFIPHRSQIHQGLVQDKFIKKEYFEDLNMLLNDYCKENDIFYIDLTSELLDEAGLEKYLYYISTDAHWNEFGHSVAAESLYRFIIDNNILND